METGGKTVSEVDSKGGGRVKREAAMFDLSATTCKMRRVDWRWAVAKGFLNKETNQWNEAMGGKEAYLKQRNERMLAR